MILNIQISISSSSEAVRECNVQEIYTWPRLIRSNTLGNSRIWMKSIKRRSTSASYAWTIFKVTTRFQNWLVTASTFSTLSAYSIGSKRRIRLGKLWARLRDDYERLKEIKEEYDPDYIFGVWFGVGAILAIDVLDNGVCVVDSLDNAIDIFVFVHFDLIDGLTVLDRLAHSIDRLPIDPNEFISHLD